MNNSKEYFVSLHNLVRGLLIEDSFDVVFNKVSIQFFPMYESAKRRKAMPINIKELITFSKYLYEMDEQDALIASCVSISLTNQIVLYSNGIDAKLKIGFKKIDEKLHSHAWVELENGEVIDPQNHLGKLQVMHIFKMRDGVERWVTENENVDSYVGRK
ncbi:hypothetical protein COM08_26715 [Bacillus wiedmannii]|uniref:lasso peptide biosynthesis B2 protein n=1 Tax=Bacillus TaxID=1386 RepID=UPI000BF8BAB8|nr:lasso peptide biosynthesis B2 protein [Bacillus wiedmannii]PGC13746.1 hypothetical protein COM08_26715 [Bacillus wiedmannii]